MGTSVLRVKATLRQRLPNLLQYSLVSGSTAGQNTPRRFGIDPNTGQSNFEINLVGVCMGEGGQKQIFNNEDCRSFDSDFEDLRAYVVLLRPDYKDTSP